MNTEATRTVITVITDLERVERRRLHAYAEWGRLKQAIIDGDPDAAVLGNIAWSTAVQCERDSDALLGRIREHVRESIRDTLPNGARR